MAKSSLSQKAGSKESSRGRNLEGWPSRSALAGHEGMHIPQIPRFALLRID